MSGLPSKKGFGCKPICYKNPFDTQSLKKKHFEETNSGGFRPGTCECKCSKGARRDASCNICLGLHWSNELICILHV